MAPLLACCRHLLVVSACSVAAAASPQLPHIFFVIVDDLGWGNVGFHRKDRSPEVRTPHLDSLVAEGVELDRHYVHMMCTPSRASFQSGRLPVHVLTNLATPCDAHGAIPRNMTGIASLLKRAGYATHQVGKWDAGMTTPLHTPQGRGYDTSLNYFGHGNWMYTEREWQGSYRNRHDVPTETPGLTAIYDLWDTDRPAHELHGTAFEEDLFRDRMLHILNNHNLSTPLFLQYDSRLVHYPLQAPIRYQKMFGSIDFEYRRVYQAMVAVLDDQIANITSTMKELGMWNNTLMVLTSDNGGYVLSPDGHCNTTLPAAGESEDVSSDVGHGTTCFNGEAGANNWPLRGGKYSQFEGGIRATAFVAGGYLPAKVRGTRLSEMMHIADWYATFAEGIAGLDPTDYWAAASDLPPIDSLNMWSLISGATATSPRKSLLVDRDILIQGEWKYVRGHTRMRGASWGGPAYPNASSAKDFIDAHAIRCPAQGCLFDVAADASEVAEVSSQHADVAKRLLAELDTQAATIWQVDHKDDPNCRVYAFNRYGGFYGPFQEVPPLPEPFVRPAGLTTLYTIIIVTISLLVVFIVNKRAVASMRKSSRKTPKGPLGPSDLCEDSGDANSPSDLREESTGHA
mmetsp:Transcript_45267/g.105023  ORF Transcript_45267/g.105023 Transcript_45267/m.105023 type:complete len:627 (-) Transcript_45267:68-1948(-)